MHLYLHVSSSMGDLALRVQLLAGLDSYIAMWGTYDIAPNHVTNIPPWARATACGELICTDYSL